MPIISPGAIPAMNSFEIDRLAVTPSRMNAMDGGMIGPITEAEATSPTDLPLSCPACTIIGTSSAPSAAASAAAEPESAERMQAAMIAT